MRASQQIEIARIATTRAHGTHRSVQISIADCGIEGAGNRPLPFGFQAIIILYILVEVAGIECVNDDLIDMPVVMGDLVELSQRQYMAWAAAQE